MLTKKVLPRVVTVAGCATLRNVLEPSLTTPDIVSVTGRPSERVPRRNLFAPELPTLAPSGFIESTSSSVSPTAPIHGKPASPSQNGNESKPTLNFTVPSETLMLSFPFTTVPSVSTRSACRVIVVMCVATCMLRPFTCTPPGRLTVPMEATEKSTDANEDTEWRCSSAPVFPITLPSLSSSLSESTPITTLPSVLSTITFPDLPSTRTPPSISVSGVAGGSGNAGEGGVDCGGVDGGGVDGGGADGGGADGGGGGWWRRGWWRRGWWRRAMVEAADGGGADGGGGGWWRRGWGRVAQVAWQWGRGWRWRGWWRRGWGRVAHVAWQRGRGWGRVAQVAWQRGHRWRWRGWGRVAQVAWQRGHRWRWRGWGRVAQVAWQWGRGWRWRGWWRRGWGRVAHVAWQRGRGWGRIAQVAWQRGRGWWRRGWGRVAQVAWQRGRGWWRRGWGRVAQVTWQWGCGWWACVALTVGCH